MKAAARKINKIEIGTKYKHSMTGVEGKVNGVFADNHSEDIRLRHVEDGKMKTTWFPLKECTLVVPVKKATVKRKAPVKKSVVKSTTAK